MTPEGLTLGSVLQKTYFDIAGMTTVNGLSTGTFHEAQYDNEI